MLQIHKKTVKLYFQLCITVSHWENYFKLFPNEENSKLKITLTLSAGSHSYTRNTNIYFLTYNENFSVKDLKTDDSYFNISEMKLSITLLYIIFDALKYDIIWTENSDVIDSFISEILKYE